MRLVNPLRRPATTPSLIADALRASIEAGESRAGAWLPQGQLAAKFGVSRIPVREALKQLEAEGLVVLHPNRGATVAELTLAEVHEVYDLRLLLEVDLLGRAVPRMTEAHLGRLAGLLREASAELGTAAQGALDVAFHRALYEPAGRPRQLGMVMVLRSAVARFQHVQSKLLRESSQFVPEHRRIVAACKAGDVRAAKKQLTLHLERARELVVAALDAD